MIALGTAGVLAVRPDIVKNVFGQSSPSPSATAARSVAPSASPTSAATPTEEPTPTEEATPTEEPTEEPTPTEEPSATPDDDYVGKIVFVTTKPTSCWVDPADIVTVATTSDTIYALGVFDRQIPAKTPLSLILYRGTKKLGSAPLAHEAVDCFYDEEDLSTWTPGTYKFVYSTTKVEAQGTIKIEE